MREFKQKHCELCNTLYQPKGSSSKYCSTSCAKEIIRRKTYHYGQTFNAKRGRKVGVGSGGTTGLGKENFMYSHGRCTFRRWARERKESIGLCEHCGKDIKNSTQHQWVGHHIDHNPTNNVIENLKVLCKQCHQIEHECWKAFEGVTTISKESRADNSSKRPTPEMGDDIVCSA